MGLLGGFGVVVGLCDMVVLVGFLRCGVRGVGLWVWVAVVVCSFCCSVFGYGFVGCASWLSLVLIVWGLL